MAVAIALALAIPPLSPLVAHESMCLLALAPLLYGRHNSGGHVAISQTRFISCGRQTGGVCESSLFPSSPCPSVARPAAACEGTRTPPIISPLLGTTLIHANLLLAARQAIWVMLMPLRPTTTRCASVVWRRSISISTARRQKETINCSIVPQVG